MLASTRHQDMSGRFHNLSSKSDAESMLMENVPIPQRAYVTDILITINVLVFWLLGNMTYTAGNNYSAVIEHGEFYRLITSMFLHVDVFHLLFNMLVLLFIGRVIEQYIGHDRFLFIYISGGLIGSIVSILFGSNQYSIGASGAIFAVLGAGIFYLSRYRDPLNCDITLWDIIKSVIIMLIFIPLIRDRDNVTRKILKYSISTIIVTFALGLLTDSGIDNWCHLGGLIGGLVLAQVLSASFDIVYRSGDDRASVRVEKSSKSFDRAFKILIAGLSLVVVSVITLIFPTCFTRIVPVENLVFELPPGVQIISSSNIPEYGVLCSESSVTCLLQAVPSNDTLLIVVRVSSSDASTLSLEQIDAEIASSQSAEVYLQYREQVTIDKHDAITSVYRRGQIIQYFTLMKDKATLLMFIGIRKTGSIDHIHDALDVLMDNVRIREL